MPAWMPEINAVASVKDVGVAMRQIDQVTTAIASAMEQQRAATREILQSVQMAASGTLTLASNITTVSGAIDETNRSARQVRTPAGRRGKSGCDKAEGRLIRLSAG
jgi:methyl-accepting chemotaxis protein